MSARKAGQSLVEKVAGRYAAGGSAARGTVRSGDFIEIAPHRVMTHDNSGSVIQKFSEDMGARTVANPSQLVLALDHNVQDRSEGNMAKYRKIAAFAAEHGVEFHPAGRGIGHQVLVEEGHVVVAGEKRVRLAAPSLSAFAAAGIRPSTHRAQLAQEHPPPRL